MTLSTPIRWACAGVGAALLLAGSAVAEDELVFGMSTALSGPAADLGVNMKHGVELAFEEANRAGGVHGRKLRLVAMDDGYEPQRTVPNMRELVASQEILGIIGNVGTPTAVASIPIALDAKVPFYGAFTGAGVLRKSPPDRYVVNFRASYAQETAAMVDALIEHAGLAPEDIGFFTQRDAYGDAGFSGGVEALRRHGVQDDTTVPHGRYERNTTAVSNGLADLLQAERTPRAVILVGAYAPCAEFIRQAREWGLEAIFLNVSFVGANPLAKELGALGDGVIVTQVVPHFESGEGAVQQYRAALEASDGPYTPSFGSLEGYVATRILLNALAQGPQTPTRESIIDSLEALGDFDLGLGVPLSLGADDHQGSAGVWPTVIRGGKVKPFDWSDLRELPAASR